MVGRHSLAVIGALGLGVLIGACRLPNADHCLHRSSDANAWCDEHEPGRSFCSPCAADHHGCVADAPTSAECPEYTAEPLESESDETAATGDMPVDESDSTG